jgi:PKD repeat protein
LTQLNGIDWIEYAEYVPVIERGYTPDDLDPVQWHLAKINAEAAWDISKGSADVTIAIVDDAVQLSHSDLSANIWSNPGEIPGNGLDNNGYIDDVNGWDVADGDNDPTPPSSVSNFSFSHGTHCAGIASAATDNSNGIAAIGYQIKILPVKGTRDSGNPRFIPYAFESWAYAISQNPDVVSMSWGTYFFSQTGQLLASLGDGRGIIQVAAAGNNNVSLRPYPAGYPEVIAVAATDRNDQKAWFSNYGDWIDVSAPGVNIYSTVGTNANAYEYYSGTSMACPLVAGLCGLMRSIDPTLTPTDVRDCLVSSADDISSANPGFTGLLGGGRINAEATLSCLQRPPIADFIANDTVICPSDSVYFTDMTQGIAPTSWSWQFPGGVPATSTAQNPSVFYPVGGTYPVTLTVTNGFGTNTLTRSGYIEVQTPSAVLSGGGTVYLGGTSPLRVDFEGDAPFVIEYSDGSASYVKGNITSNPYYLYVSPTTTTSYSLIKMSSSDCEGNASGTATVVVDSTVSLDPVTDCELVLGSYQKISSTQGGFGSGLDNGDEFGDARLIGDLDNDGVQDLAVASFRDDDGTSNTGAIYILFMNSDGTVRSKQKISNTSGGFPNILDQFNGFAVGIDALGDFDGTAFAFKSR